MSDESLPKTLYVGNLSHNVTEQFLYTLFGSIGPIQSCKIIREINSDPYAFVEYETHINAFTALGAMNKRQLYDREIKVSLLFFSPIFRITMCIYNQSIFFSFI